MAHIFITGSTDGLGLAAAQSLIDDGHEVVLHARSAERGSVLAAVLPHSAGLVVGDLSSAVETRSIADQVNAIGRMDAIIHNAGIYRERSRGSTPEGHATTFAVNTLAPYLLTALIERPRRQIYLSSGLHRGGEGSLRDIDWIKRRWDSGQAYAETKLQVAALAFALARRWPNLLSNAVDPGWVRTKMGGRWAPVGLDAGQRTQTWLAVSNDPAAMVNGHYWHHLREEQPAGEVTDIAFQDRLLAELRDITGVALP
jgi:NAD(P)-dependent dehydrogenase (short-subunit alcohol dehydrogenase family)